MTLDEFKARAKNDLDRAYEAGKAQSGGGGYDEGFEAGKKAEYDRFWDAYQENGARTTYSYVFCGFGWNDEAYQPKYNLGPVKAVNNMYFYSRITDTKLPINLTGVTNGNTSAMFQGASSLKTIRTLTVAENTTFANTFNNCSALENITFEGVIGNSISFANCSLLDAESIDDIFKHLGGSATATLTLPSTAQATYNAKYGEGTFQTKVNSAPLNWTIGW